MAIRVADDFNRANSATLGTSSSGHTWTNGASTTIGVIDNQAYMSGAVTGDGVWYLSTGTDFSDVRVEATIATLQDDPTDTDGWGLRFRRADENNWWEFGTNTLDTTYVLRKMVAGDLFIVDEPGVERAPDDIIRVDCFDSVINCYVNQTLVASIVDTDLQANTHAGIRVSVGASETRLDNFSALQLTSSISLDNFPEYQVWVDWDNDGGLTLADFESEDSIEGFTGFGSIAPVLEVSREQVKSGNQSMKVTWANWNLLQFDTAGHGFDQGKFGGDEFVNPPISFKFNQAGQGFDDGAFAVTRVEANPTVVTPGFKDVVPNLIVGRVYDVKCWIWIPTGSTAMTFGIEGIGTVTSTLNDVWEELSFTYTATATSHNVIFSPTTSNPDEGDIAFVDQIVNLGAFEDITCYVVGDSINFKFGRDQARSLASIAPGEVELELDNSTQIFSPDNPGSVLAGYLAPGKPMLIRVNYNNQTTNLFHGFIDNYTLHPDPEDQSVTMTCMDVLQWVANTDVTTALYPTIQTGEAINVILDTIGWPAEKRDIDQGATTVRWWWLEAANGIDAIQDLVSSEGIPASCYVDPFGNLVFRSRHHRQLRNQSRAIQAYIRSCNEFDEPAFSGPITYDIGWKDIINRVEVEIEERIPEPFGEVYTSNDPIEIPAGETYTHRFKTSNPFYGAVTPSVADETIELGGGSGQPSSVNLSVDAGQSGAITITAGASVVRIKKITLNAFQVTAPKTRKSFNEDTTSIETYGPQSTTSEFPWANLNDMDSIAQVILGQRSDRLPVVYIKLNNGHPIRISNMLKRQLSDRVHLVEYLQTFMNDDYFIEVIEHNIEAGGRKHTVTLGCEKAREQSVIEQDENPLPVFTFDVAGQGFDDGYFVEGGEGFTLTDNLFILDESLLDQDGLGF